MNIFYISHVPIYSNYGAGTSFRHQIDILKKKYQTKINIVIFYRISPRQVFMSIASSYKYFKEKRILALPIFTDWDLTYDYEHKVKKKNRFNFNFLKKLSYKLSAYEINLFINFFNPEIIHLNSHILLSFFNRVKRKNNFKNQKIKVICHIRDFVSNLKEKDVISFQNIDNFICIDSASRESLLRNIGFLKMKTVIIPNPFKAIKSTKEFNFQVKINNYDLIIGFVGTLINDKGIDFIVDSLAKFKTVKKIAFIIVGDGLLYKSIINKSKIIKNIDIVLTGLVESLSESNFYEQIDLLIRGDKSFRTGRTVFEALYQGKDVLIPKSINQEIQESQLEIFKNSVHFYKARDTRSFIESLEVFIKDFKNNSHQKTIKNNFSEYAESIENIYFN